MSKIGFVVISHSHPEQLYRLSNRLGSMFGGATIACAHDFGQAPLDPHSFPSFVSFVSPFTETRWASISIVHAAMRAVRQLYETADPDWFVLLSSSDYPVAPSQGIIGDLDTGHFDAFINFREVTLPCRLPLGADYRRANYGFDDPRWAILGYDRYIARQFTYPWLGQKMRFERRSLFIRRSWLVWPFHPFKPSLRCFGGEFWFTANRRSARVLIDEYERGERLIKHFTNRFCPEEAFFQTVLCNQPGLILSNDNKRYIDWSQGGPHPKLLAADDLGAINASGAHFARKFAPASPALELLDRVIDECS